MAAFSSARSAYIRFSFAIVLEYRDYSGLPNVDFPHDRS